MADHMTLSGGFFSLGLTTVFKKDHRGVDASQAGDYVMVLPDVLQCGLKVVFCGTALGDCSACRGAYYAGPGNRFWDVLAETGLTTHRLSPEEYPLLLGFGIGLTDLVKIKSGQDMGLRAMDYDVAGFRAKIEKHAPMTVGFNGKKAAQVFIGRTPVEYGLQREKIEGATLFVLPSTSGAARGFWDSKYWLQLARYVTGQKRTGVA